MHKLFGAVVAVVGCFLSVAYGGENTLVKICYVPLGVETYAPVTMANIDDHCSHVGELDVHDKRFLELQTLIRGASLGSFVDGYVRVKISIRDSDTIFIDNYGGVRMGELQYHLDDSSLVKARKILEKGTRQKVPGSN